MEEVKKFVGSETDRATLQETEDLNRDNWNLRRIISTKKKIERRVSSYDPSYADPTLSVPGGDTYLPSKSPKPYEVSPSVPFSTDYMAREAEKTKFIIRISRPFRIRWDLCVMLMAAWNCFLTPYTIAYRDFFSENNFITIVNGLIDVVFFIDLVLNFKTSFYMESTGDEVLDSKTIAKNYLMGQFWIDFLACIPTDLIIVFYGETNEIEATTLLYLFGLLKLYRISRLNRIINYMRARNDVKLVLRISQLFFFLIMYIHLVSCAWWIIISYDEDWLTPNSTYEDIFEQENGDKYWVSFYISVIMLCGGEILPRNGLQACFAGFLILIGAMINAVMFGNMAVLMDNLNMRQTKFQEQQNSANTAMKNMKISEELQQKISDYLIYTEATMASQRDFETLYSLISPSLYNKVLHCLFEAILKQNPVLKKDKRMAEFILPKLKPHFCKPEEVLVVQGEDCENKCMYFIARGDCQVTVRDERKRTKQIGILGPGSHFGEVALLVGGHRTATVVAKNYCTLAILDKENFTQLVKKFPMCNEIFKEGMYNYSDRYKRFLLRMIKRVPFLNELNHKTEQELVYGLKVRNFAAGEYIVKPGDVPNEIYFLADGKIEVSITLNDKDLETRKNTFYLQGTQLIRTDSEEKISLKKHTELYPLFGNAGTMGALHSTELNFSSKMNSGLIGSHCVELVLKKLNPGSVLGLFSTIISEKYIFQAKTLKDCTLYCLSKNCINRLRKSSKDLNVNLSNYEHWSKLNTPYVDDFVFAYDSKPSKVFNLNENRGRDRFKGAILRVVKENREKKILNTPLIALMMKNFKQLKTEKNYKSTSAAGKILNAAFNPNIRKKIMKQNSDEITQETMNNIEHTLLKNSQALNQLSAKLASVTKHIKNKGKAKLPKLKINKQTQTAEQDTKEELDPKYKTSTFTMHRGLNR